MAPASLPELPEPTRIRLGYLLRSGDRQVWVQVARRADGAETGAIGVNGPADLAIDEFVYGVPPDDAAFMLDHLCAAGQVQKVRCVLAVDGHVFTAAVYGGHLEGLATAEADLGPSGGAVALPPWVVADVTGDRRFTDTALSQLSTRAAAALVREVISVALRTGS